MSWFVEAATSPATSKLSSSRVIALVAGFTLCYSVGLLSTVLAVGVFVKMEAAIVSQLASIVMMLGSILGTMAGAGYVTNKIAQGKKDDSLT